MNNAFTRPSGGWIEVIAGCMFSGKTEELLKQVRRARFARQAIQVFKPVLDVRYRALDVTSHDQNFSEATVVHGAAELLRLVHAQSEVIAIDEAQFFGAEIVDITMHLADQGRRVILAGLDTDWRGRPFGPMPQLLAVAELVTKLHAVCAECGAPASRTQRRSNLTDDILVGSSEAYEARCRRHFNLTEFSHPLTLPEL